MWVSVTEACIIMRVRTRVRDHVMEVTWDQEGVPADVCVLPESLLPALGNMGGEMWIALPLVMSLSGYHIGTTTVLLWWKVDTPIKQKQKRDKEKVVDNRGNLKIPGVGMLVFPFVCSISTTFYSKREL